MSASGLFQIARAEGIAVIFYSFPKQPKIYGVYAKLPGWRHPVIGLDGDLVRYPAALRTHFAHELGHHFTVGSTATTWLSIGPNNLYTHKWHEWEVQAWRWAGELLMPCALVERALSTQNPVIVLAGLANVTPEFAAWRIEDYTRRVKKEERRWLVYLPRQGHPSAGSISASPPVDKPRKAPRHNAIS